MAMIVILMSGDAKDLSFDAQTLATVAELGITSLALLRDDDTLALVADGWAFDAAKSQQVIDGLMRAASRPVRTLHSVGLVVLEGPAYESRPEGIQRL